MKGWCAKQYSFAECSAANLPFLLKGNTMMKVPAPSLRQLVSRLHAQALDMATLRSALNLQFTRIAHRQAELDRFATWPVDGGRQLRRTVGPTPVAYGRRRSIVPNDQR